MRRKQVIIIVVVIVFGACMLSHVLPHASTQSVTTTVTPVTVPGPSQSSQVLALLTALHQYGWNPAARGGMGGLWLTWRMGPNSGTNFGDDGTPASASATPTVDTLLDLRALDALWRVQRLAPNATALDPWRIQLTTIIKHLAPFPQELREGAIYATLEDLAQLSGDAWYTTTAQTLIARDVATLYHPQLGAIYWVDDQHPLGWYRTAETLELAQAFVAEGTRSGQSAWVVAGQHAAAFVQAHAYLPLYRVFLSRMGNVSLADGSANPNELILRESNDQIPDDGGAIDTGDVAREAMALMSIGTATQDAALEQVGTTLLGDELPATNHLNLWDATNGGYATSVTFLGLAYAYPGRPLSPALQKRPLDQAFMLQAYQMAQSLHSGAYTAQISQLALTITNRAIVTPGPGIIDVVSSTWSPLTLPGGGQHTWYDSMSIVEVATTLMPLESATTTTPSS